MTKKDVSYQDKLNELRLDTKHPNNRGIVFIFLEGESDVRLFRKLFDLEKAKVEIIPGGKFKLEECVEILLQQYNLILGIRDSDFEHLNPKVNEKENIVLTDKHDMEMCMFFQIDVWHSILHEYTNYSKSKHPEIRDDILRILFPISLIKWLNEIENLEFKFDCSFVDLLNFESNSIDINEYLKRLLSKSPNAKIKEIKTIISKIGSLKKLQPDKYHLINGHDFITALTIYLKEYGDTRTINEKHIQSLLRTTYSHTFFQETKMFETIQFWCNSNQCHILQ